MVLLIDYWFKIKQIIIITFYIIRILKCLYYNIYTNIMFAYYGFLFLFIQY